MVTRRQGGRSERVRLSVLDAALELLLANGYDGLKVRDVALAASVAETTIYRRWPTTHDLAAAAVAHLAHTDNPIPTRAASKGTSARCWVRCSRCCGAVTSSGSCAPRQRSTAPTRTPSRARKNFWRGRFAGSAPIVERAVDRGELAVGTDPQSLVEFLVGPAYLRLLLLDRPLDDALLDESVRLTIAAYGSRATSNE